MTGYKAVDKDMRGMNNYQYELGKLHIHDGKLVMCISGFHFCVYPSGVWSYRNEPGTRVFKVEAYDVHPVSKGYGSYVKYVAKKIKLIEEIKIDSKRNTGDCSAGDCNAGDCNTGDSNTGHSNTGHYNTGDWNTGDWNTGDWNTGNRNTGDWNTGHYNTGHRNTGYYNTGHSNAGEYNTGDCNTGDYNTGHRNTGDRNTGDSNTGHNNAGDCNTGHSNAGYRNIGDWNTGIGNATNRSAGFFCMETKKVESFDVQTNLTYEQYMEKYPEYNNLSRNLLKDDPIDFDKYKNIPGITPQKLKELHNKFKKARKK